MKAKNSGLADGIAASQVAAYIVLAMLAMVVVPAGITLHTVRIPATSQVLDPNPTPYGYTTSLLLFIIPIIVIAGWFLPVEGLKIPQRAFWRTIVILVPFGFALDFFFASRFFIFRNPGATLKIPAPAIGGWVPVEEYIFYLTGFIAVLLIYIWLGEFWLASYSVADYRVGAKAIRRLLQFHPSSVVLGLVLIVLAVIFKKLFSKNPEGFPGYFTFLVAVSMVPSAVFSRRFGRLLTGGP